MSPQGYSRLQIALHWLIAVLLIVSFFSSDGMKSAWRAVERGAAEVTVGTGATLHIWVGISILVLTLLRLAIRLKRGAPESTGAGPAILETLARLGHWALYALLLAIPAAGMLAWFGALKNFADLHEILFNVGWVMVALHTAAALFHQFVLKDNLLRRMRRPG